MKKLTTETIQEIGETVGGMKGFAVAKAYQRMKEGMVKDAVLRGEVKILSVNLSCVKG